MLLYAANKILFAFSPKKICNFLRRKCKKNLIKAARFLSFGQASKYLFTQATEGFSYFPNFNDRRKDRLNIKECSNDQDQRRNHLNERYYRNRLLAV